MSSAQGPFADPRDTNRLLAPADRAAGSAVVIRVSFRSLRDEADLQAAAGQEAQVVAFW